MEQKATNPQMTLEEYKKKVKDSYLKRYPHTTEEDFQAEVATISKEAWEQYMKDFSPEILPAAWAAGA